MADTSAIPPNKVIPIDLRRDGSKDGTHIQGAQVQAALKWKNKAKDKVSEKESQEAALVDSVFDVITFDPNAMDDDVDDGVVATEAAASKAETNTNASSAAKVQSNTHRRLSLVCHVLLCRVMYCSSRMNFVILCLDNILHINTDNSNAVGSMCIASMLHVDARVKSC